jgi:hypothetical protein
VASIPPEDGIVTFLQNVGYNKTYKHHTPEDGILHSNRCENLKSYVPLTGWALYRRRNVFLVRYGQKEREQTPWPLVRKRTISTVAYITDDGILHSHRRVNLKSYIALTGWAL